MWIIIRTVKGKNSFLAGLGQWTKDRNDAERYEQFSDAVYWRDKQVAPHQRRGVGVVKLD